MRQTLRDAVKNSYSKLFAALYSRFRDIDLVEDGIQDALERAMLKWEDPPRDPLAWLYKSAKNSILDTLKRKSSQAIEFSEEHHGTGEPTSLLDSADEMDEQLRLMCLCCHPALAERVQILLTLRLVAGLSTDEIAAALVMKPKTVGQALTRAKEKIKLAGLPFKSPDPSHLAERLEAIRKIIYLMFNEGFHSNSNHSLYRVDLCNESIRLSRILLAAGGRDHASLSLLALLLFQNSRSKARTSPDGEPVLLENQNRRLWDSAAIDEARGIFQQLLASIPEPPSPYFFQAAIAREHAIAPSFAMSNWGRICQIYAELYYLNPDPIVLLSWVGAEAHRTSSSAALELMERFELRRHLSDYRWFYSTRGELLARVGDHAAAVRDIETAISLTQNPGERRFLERKIRELSRLESGPGPSLPR